MSAIETRGLTREFGKLTAVDDLDLSVEEGALFGFIGPNGAGKTTTLRLLAGLLEPTAGEVTVVGIPVGKDPRAVHRLIGYMPDFFGVYEDMQVWEYLDFFARCYDIPAARRRQVVVELLDLVDLAEKRDGFVQTLSRGMRQRLCLAHALVHDPQILLLDEPASGLDPRARVEMRELLKELQAMGKTLIVSSHILSELEEICDRVGIIEQGKLLFSGAVEDVYRQVGQERVLRIRIISDREEALAALQDYPGVGEVGEVVEANGQLEVEFSGDDWALAGLHAHLVNSGVALTHFSGAVGDLEEVFLQVTKGEVA